MSLPIPPAGNPVELEDWETQTELNPKSTVFVPNRTQFSPSPSHLASSNTTTSRTLAQNGFDEWNRASSTPSAANTTTCGWDQNRQIWEAANTPAPLMYSQDFPSLHNGSSTTFSHRSAGPSPAINQLYSPQYTMYPNSNPSSGVQSTTSSPGGPTPKITLLKRPTDSTNKSPSGSRGATPPAGVGRSLTEREEDYRKARERIFATGTTDSRTKSPRGSANENGSQHAVREGDRNPSAVHRQPTGPPVNGSPGFGSNNSSRSGSGSGRGRRRD